MTKTTQPATLLCDFYKLAHREQYPEKTEVIYSTLTPRSNKYFPEAEGAVVFGIQAFIKKYLIGYFNTHFFNRKKEAVVAEYKRFLTFAMGQTDPDASHIEALHDLGYLPISIHALKEGTIAPIRVPVLTIENTHKDFFWLTNYLETLLSAETWLSMTAATIAHEYRKVLDAAAMRTVGSLDGVGFQGHDFSMRGMSSLESAKYSGAGHLLSFTGTDTIPAIYHLEEYYNANIETELIGGSIPATEHSVMSANTSADSRDEYAMFKRLLTEIYPTGLFSAVSDTYDFWEVVGNVLPKLKKEIMGRDGKLVIRPDSGDPVLILCGDPNAKEEIVQKGLIEALWDTFGGSVSEKGFKLLDSHIGAIYGDSITLARAKEITERLEAKGFASTNVVFGIGSYTYQFNTRDTLGFAVKAPYAVIDGKEQLLFKDPKTDDGTKRSQRGRVVVLSNPETGKLECVEGLTKDMQESYTSENLLTPVFHNGILLSDQSLAGIRARLAAQ